MFKFLRLRSSGMTSCNLVGEYHSLEEIVVGVVLAQKNSFSAPITEEPCPYKTSI